MNPRNIFSRQWFGTTTSILLGAAILHAEESPPASKNEATINAEELSPWEFSASSGVNISSGNSETATITFQALASYIDDANELYFGADYFFGENEDATSLDSLRVYKNYNRLITERFYIGADGEYFRDQVADIDYRISALPKLGYYIVKSDEFQFALEGGAGYQMEKQGGIEDNSAAFYAGQRMKFQLNANTSLFQFAGLVAEAGDVNNYRLQSDLGITTRINNHWALSVFARDTYDATPAAGAEENDLALMTTLTYAFGGFSDDPEKSERRSLWVDEATPDTPETGWESSAAAGFSLTQGNSETLAVTANFDTAYRSAAKEFFFHLGGAYGEDGDATTIQSVNANVHYNRFLSERSYAGAVTTALHDEISFVDYRMTPAIAIGNYLVKNNTISLAIEAGPGYTFEKVAGLEDDYLVVYGGQRFSWAISESISFKQSLTGTLDPDNTTNFILRGEASLDLALASNLALRTGLAIVYDNEPAAVDDTDTLLSTSLVYKF